MTLSPILPAQWIAELHQYVFYDQMLCLILFHNLSGLSFDEPSLLPGSN